jgi:hypothetical protein
LDDSDDEYDADVMGRRVLKGPAELVMYDEVCDLSGTNAMDLGAASWKATKLKRRAVPEISNGAAKRFLTRAKDYYMDYVDYRTTRAAKEAAFTNAKRLYGIFGVCQLLANDEDWHEIVRVKVYSYID